MIMWKDIIKYILDMIPDITSQIIIYHIVAITLAISVFIILCIVDKIKALKAYRTTFILSKKDREKRVIHRNDLIICVIGLVAFIMFAIVSIVAILTT